MVTCTERLLSTPRPGTQMGLLRFNLEYLVKCRKLCNCEF